jgi:hypothetical protein
MAKAKRRPGRRNPMAAMARKLRPRIVASAKRYKRRSKHKGRPEDDPGDSS